LPYQPIEKNHTGIKAEAETDLEKKDKKKL
jgi:hypothetical protein